MTRLINSWLVATLALALAADDGIVAWKPRAGQSVSHEYETELAISCAGGEVRVYHDGVGVADAPVGARDRELRQRATIIESRSAVEGGRPTLLRRNYDEVASSRHAGHLRRPSERSELDSRTVLLRWNADRQLYERELLDSGQRGTARQKELVQLVERLPVETEFQFFLPPEQCAKGAEWTVVAGRVGELDPVSGLFLEREAVEVKSERAAGIVLNPAFAGGLLGLKSLMASPTGEIGCTFLGFDEVGGIRVASIALDVNVQGTVDAPPPFRDAFEAGVPAELPVEASVEYTHVLKSHLAGQGELTWDVASGALRDLKLTCDLSIVEEMEAAVTVSNEAGESSRVSTEATANWQGSYSVAVRARDA